MLSHLGCKSTPTKPWRKPWQDSKAPISHGTEGQGKDGHPAVGRAERPASHGSQLHLSTAHADAILERV